MTQEPHDPRSRNRPYRVIVEWHGGSLEIERLFSALAHLEPGLVGGTRSVAVDVLAEGAAEAEAYVEELLRLHDLTASATVVHT